MILTGTEGVGDVQFVRLIKIGQPFILVLSC